MMVRTYIFVERRHLPGEGLRSLLTLASLIVHVDDERVDVAAGRTNALVG